MDGKAIADLMRDGWLNGALAKHARRYSSNIEDQEEYIQDAWLRISGKPGGRTLDYYEEEGRKAILSAYHRKYYPKRVCKKKVDNTNGISVTGEEAKPPPKRCIKVGDRKYLDPKHVTIDWQYYEGQEEEMESGARFCLEWYNQHEGFESLTEGDRKKVVHRFMNSGYHVGRAIGSTPGKKVRFYYMYYTVDHSGVVKKTKPPREFVIGAPLPGTAGDWGKEKMDLSPWYKLRALGGDDGWMAELNEIIGRLEKHVEGVPC